MTHCTAAAGWYPLWGACRLLLEAAMPSSANGGCAHAPKAALCAAHACTLLCRMAGSSNPFRPACLVIWHFSGGIIDSCGAVMGLHGQCTCASLLPTCRCGDMQPGAAKCKALLRGGGGACTATYRRGNLCGVLLVVCTYWSGTGRRRLMPPKGRRPASCSRATLCTAPGVTDLALHMAATFTCPCCGGSRACQ